MSALEVFLRRWARWPVILSLAALAVALMTIIQPLFTPVPGIVPPDARLTYTAAELKRAMTSLSPSQRATVAQAHLTVDMVYPLVYGLLILLLLARAGTLRRAWLFVPLAVAADWAENVLLSLLYLGVSNRLTVLARWAAMATTLKWGLIAVAVAFVVVGGGRRVVGEFTPFQKGEG